MKCVAQMPEALQTPVRRSKARPPQTSARRHVGKGIERGQRRGRANERRERHKPIVMLRRQAG